MIYPLGLLAYFLIAKQLFITLPGSVIFSFQFSLVLFSYWFFNYLILTLASIKQFRMQTPTKFEIAFSTYISIFSI
jgi:hypothetical protein